MENACFIVYHTGKCQENDRELLVAAIGRGKELIVSAQSIPFINCCISE